MQTQGEKDKLTQGKYKDQMDWLYALADWLNPPEDWLYARAD